MVFKHKKAFKSFFPVVKSTASFFVMQIRPNGKMLFCLRGRDTKSLLLAH